MSGLLGQAVAPGWGSPQVTQPQTGLLGASAGGNDDELANALAQLYSSMGTATGTPAGQAANPAALGAANQIRNAIQQSGDANQQFQEARQQGIQTGYPITPEDAKKVLQTAMISNWSGAEGGGGNGGGQR
jgi:hypothetical protein